MLHNKLRKYTCNRVVIARFIAKLLHPTANVDLSLSPPNQVFWNCLVKFGSSQLVLPAIYGALKRKKLLKYVPKDLINYLHQITTLNYNRNTDILKQISFLSEVFNGHQIDYVFLKGAAMLITKPYETKSERMLGDIDILVSKKDLHIAKKLLINIGFEEVSDEFSFTEDIFSEGYNRHLDRIIHPNFIAAVELHRSLLKKHNNLLSPEYVLRNKVKTKSGQWVPSKQHLWEHAILNNQYNDYGISRNYLHFRSVVDILYLDFQVDNIKHKLIPKAIKHFYSLMSFYYDEYKNYYPLKKTFYKWQLQSVVFDRLQYFFSKSISFVSLGLTRLGLFLKSNNYRKRVLQNPKIFLQRIFEFWNK